MCAAYTFWTGQLIINGYGANMKKNVKIVTGASSLKKNAIGLEKRILFFSTILMVAFGAIVTVICLIQSLDITAQAYALEGAQMTKNAASRINADKFASLAKSLDEKDPYYSEM
jgi:hypothetical protein